MNKFEHFFKKTQNESKAQEILFSLFGESKKQQENLLFTCPKCNTKGRLAVNIKKNAFKCWHADCEYSSDIDKFGQKSTRRTLTKLIVETKNSLVIKDWFELIKDLVNKRKSDSDLKFDLERFEEIIEEFLNLNKNSSKKEGVIKLNKAFELITPYNNKEAFEYLTIQRRLTIEDIIRWKVGFINKMELSKEERKFYKRIIIPSFDKEGNVNYFVGRKYGDEKGKRPKYVNSRKSKFDIIFNELNVDWNNKELFLVEGVFDAMKIGAYSNAIILLGVEMSEKYKIAQQIIKHDIKKVYLVFDNDVSFSNKIKFLKKLKDIEVAHTYLINTVQGKDIGD